MKIVRILSKPANPFERLDPGVALSIRKINRDGRHVKPKIPVVEMG